MHANRFHQKKKKSKKFISNALCTRKAFESIVRDKICVITMSRRTGNLHILYVRSRVWVVSVVCLSYLRVFLHSKKHQHQTRMVMTFFVSQSHNLLDIESITKLNTIHDVMKFTQFRSCYAERHILTAIRQQNPANRFQNQNKILSNSPKVIKHSTINRFASNLR